MAKHTQITPVVGAGIGPKRGAHLRAVRIHLRWRLGFVLGCVLVLSSSAVATESERSALLQRFGGRDVAVLGRIVDVQAVTRGAVRTDCGEGSWGPTIATDVTVAVDSVLYGSIESGTITVTAFAGMTSNLVPPLPTGSRAIVAANRLCSDTWRMWGAVALLPELGHAVIDPLLLQGPMIIGEEPLTSLDESLLRESLASDGAQSFDSLLAISSGIGVVRVRSIVSNAPGSDIVVECDSAFALLGAFPLDSVTVSFVRPAFCFPTHLPGTRLIVPLAARIGSTTNFRMRGCPRTWKVFDEYSPRLGLTLEFIEYALAPSASGWQVMQVHDLTENE